MIRKSLSLLCFLESNSMKKSIKLTSCLKKSEEEFYLLKKKTMNKNLFLFLAVFIVGNSVFASSHREAPLIANDPLADNTDLCI